MKIIYKKAFFKDLKKADKDIFIKLKSVILFVKKIENTNELDIIDLEKLKWFKYYYRIRIWDYRIWLKIENDEIHLLRVLHRKDIYKKFP